MKAMGVVGAVRGKDPRTTVDAALASRPGDLVNRTFAVPAPSKLWVADLEPSFNVACMTQSAVVGIPSERTFPFAWNRPAPAAERTGRP